MTWNFGALIPRESHSDTRYPIPTSSKPYVVQEPGDGSAESFTVLGVQVTRIVAGQTPQQVFSQKWVGRVGEYTPDLLVTQSRVIFINRKPGITKRGQSWVGHIRFPWITEVEARLGALGFSNNTIPAIRLRAVDGNDLVLAEFSLGGSAKRPAHAAQLILDGTLADRLARAEGAGSTELQQDVKALMGLQMTGAKREYQAARVPGAVRVGT